MIFAVDLLKPFTYEFFRNGLLIATLAGALCGLIGVFVVLRGMSYIGHGLSHAVFGGAALAAAPVTQLTCSVLFTTTGAG